MEISERTFAMSTYGGLIIQAIQGVGATDAIYYCILKLSRDVGTPKCQTSQSCETVGNSESGVNAQHIGNAKEM